MKKLIKLFLILAVCGNIFLIRCDSGGGDDVDIDQALVGDWMEYGSASFSAFADDGIHLQADGNVFDIDTNDGWSSYYVDYSDHEGKFTTLMNGVIAGVNLETSTALPFTGTYTLGTYNSSTTIILNINENGTIITYYYLKAD